MLNYKDKKQLKNYVIEWAKKYHYFDGKGTLSKHVDYDVAYDMKNDVEESVNIPIDEFDDWYDLFIEDALLPILRELGAINEDE